MRFECSMTIKSASKSQFKARVSWIHAAQGMHGQHIAAMTHQCISSASRHGAEAGRRHGRVWEAASGTDRAVELSGCHVLSQAEYRTPAWVDQGNDPLPTRPTFRKWATDEGSRRTNHGATEPLLETTKARRTSHQTGGRRRMGLGDSAGGGQRADDLHQLILTRRGGAGQRISSRQRQEHTSRICVMGDRTEQHADLRESLPTCDGPGSATQSQVPSSWVPYHATGCAASPRSGATTNCSDLPTHWPCGR